LAVRSEYTFDAAGNLVQQTEDAGAGRLNLTTLYTYTLVSGRYRSSEVMDAAGNVKHFVYSATGELVSEIDALQQTTTYTSGYTAEGRWAQVTTAGGRTTTTASNAEGQPVRIIDPAGGVTLYTYDALGRLQSTTTGAAAIGGQPALNRTMTTTYDVHGRVVGVTDALGNTSTRSYDAFGRLASEADALGNTTLYSYDALDRLVRVTTGANVPGEALSTSYTYDAAGRTLTMHADPDGLNLTTTYRYTRPGSSDTWSLQEVVDARGNVTAYSYNSLGQLAATTDALNQTWSFSYDNLGRQLAQIDPLSRTTTYAVDALGRRTSLTLDGRTEQWAYRPDGMLAAAMDFAGRVTTFGYDPDGELTSIDYPEGTADVSYVYDLAGNVTSMSDGLGVTSYSYDVLGQRLSRSRNGRTVSYAYTLNGQVGQIGYWNQGSVQYVYDATGRLTGLAAWGAAATGYTYRSTGLLAGVSRTNSVNTGYTYDMASRLTGVNGIGYILDANGNRIQMSDWEGVTTYTYDALDRLMQAIYPTSTVTYTLDSVGNRLSDSGNVFGYDPSDRITNPGYTYDANGNLLSDGTATYEYDAANRLILTTRNGVVTTYGYDGWGNLIQETVNGVTTEFVLDENAAYTRILGEVRSDGGERLYAYGAEGFTTQQTIGGGVEYPLLDGLGSVRQLTDAAGVVILTRSYDAFGAVRYAAGAGVTRLGYTGEMQDSASGLVYLRARHYHPVLGRFIQRDSFDGFIQGPQSLNRYSYAVNNPVRFFDPGGHCAVNSNGSRSASDAECWRLADIIYAMWGAGDPWFPERFHGIGRDDFMRQVAAAGPSLDAAWMQWQLDQWRADFAASHGLQIDVVWHEPVNPPVRLPGQVVVEDAWICIVRWQDCGCLLDDLSVAASTVAVGCALTGVAPCAVGASRTSTFLGATGTALGAHNASAGNGTWLDVGVSGVTTVVGGSSIGAKPSGTNIVSWIASVVQWLWDH
jgi:RHS repeat-associated protein